MHDREYSQEELQKWRLWSHVTFVILGMIIIVAYIVMKDVGLTADEGWHAHQISMFMHREWAIDPGLTTIPGFHAIIAMIASLIGEESIGFLRFLSMIISILAIEACRRILLKISPHLVIVRLCQIALLPILFPYFSLLYTDVTALTFVLWGMLAFCHQRYTSSFILVALSILVRQMNIMWFLFIVGGWLMTEHGTLIQSLNRYEWTKAFSALRKLFLTRKDCIRILIVALTMLLFGLFVILNGGVAIGDQGAHPFPGLHLGNIFFMSGVFTILFFPYVLSTLPTIFRHILRTEWVIPALVALFVIYMIFAWNSHGYNQDINSYFLRNRILAHTTSNPWTQMFGFIAVSLGLASFMVTRMQKPWIYLLGASILCLLPSWLIEQRYYIIPYALFLLFRAPNTSRTEVSLAIYEAILTGILFWIVLSGTLFI